MRISSSWSHQVGLNSMLSQQSKLTRTQLQLSTGLKNNLPSDDPVAATKALAFKNEIKQIGQYLRNINTARERNSHEESALSSAQDLLLRAKDLSLQSVNGIMSADDRLAIKVEIDQLSDQLLSIANTQRANGEYLFSGYLSKTKPFELNASNIIGYLGTEDQRSIQIGEGHRVADGNAGFEVFENIDSVTGGKRSIFSTLKSLSTALANNVSNINHEMGDLDNALESLTRVRSTVGSRLRTLDSQEEQNEKFLLDFKSTLSDIEDLDYAEAISRFNQQDNTLKAAQQSFARLQKLSLFDYL